MNNKLQISFVLCFCLLAFTVVANAQDNSFSNTSQEKSKSTPVRILKKPKTQIGNCSESRGDVRLKVTFDKSATITDVEIIETSGCESFEKNAMRSAWNIEFEPATENGEPITVVKTIEYMFSRH